MQIYKKTQEYLTAVLGKDTIKNKLYGIITMLPLIYGKYNKTYLFGITKAS